MEPYETANCLANAMNTSQYHIDRSATRHFIGEVEALHDYVPFETPCDVTTADGTTQGDEARAAERPSL
jgi:hypothetical protein